MSFSERYGYKPVKEIIQIESIDEPLRNGIWSLLKIYCWDYGERSPGIYGSYYISEDSNKDLYHLCVSLWLNYFKYPLDNLDHNWTEVLKQLRSYFFSCKWYEVYDFIEFVVSNYMRYNFKTSFLNSCNHLLEKEVSAYRFLDGVITRITEAEEINEIESALTINTIPVKTHLKRALELLSDRNTPDYRNSIKEAISAVESLAADVLGKESSTLGNLLRKMESEKGLHPALKSAFSSLYGYTSDANGIRHALIEINTNDFHDAKFMLVVCSAFINFIKGKIVR
jgi:AbiJ N-terminal domain 4